MRRNVYLLIYLKSTNSLQQLLFSRILSKYQLITLVIWWCNYWLARDDIMSCFILLRHQGCQRILNFSVMAVRDISRATNLSRDIQEKCYVNACFFCRLDSQCKFQMFTLFSRRLIYHGGTPTRLLHTWLCKFVQKNSTNI